MEKAFSEISRALKEQIHATTLLFLNNIESLYISIEGESNNIEITKADRERKGSGGNVLDVNLQYAWVNCANGKRREHEDDYLLFTDCEEEAVKLAFKIKDKELIAVPNTSIYTFFPTDKESHQSFYIHAPFETTPARDNIVEDSARNAVFIENICSGIQMAFCWMRDEGYLSIAGLNGTYPIYEYPADSIFHRIYECAVDMIQMGEKILPTNQSGVYKSRFEIIMPDNMSIVDNFPDEDIQRLFSNHKLFWISKEISTVAYQGFREFLRKNFEFKIYTWKDVILKLDSSYLEQKERSWYEKLFTAIHNFAMDGTGRSLGSHDIDVSKIPFVRLVNRKNVCAYVDGKPFVYINNPNSCPNIIEKTFCDSDVIRSFYTINLRIPFYNVERIAVDDILPKYAVRDMIKVSTTDLTENKSDLKIIKDALIISKGLMAQVMEAYIVTDGKSWYRPDELHIPSGFAGRKTIAEYNMVKGICNLKFLAMEYQQDPKLDDKFFLQLGCAASLRITKLTKDKYLSLVRKYIGRDESDEIRIAIFNKQYQSGFDWSILFEGFPEVFETVDIKKSRAIARFLNKNTTRFEIQGNIMGANDQNFNGSHVDSKKMYSAIGLLLVFEPWIYDKTGVKVAVSDVLRRDIDPIYEKESKHLLDILPFKEEDKEIEAILQRISNPQEREAMKELLTNPDTLTQITKAMQEQRARELKRNQKRNKTPEEILAEMSKKTGRRGADKNDSDPEAIKNLERRKKKLEQEFEKSMGYKIAVPKSHLKYTYQEQLTSEEKIFLKAQYNGYCQICDTTIVCHDGEHHFQAINVIKTTELDDKFRDSLSMGWNSLCLCPNCAAKYRYGIKDISDFAFQVQNTEIEPGSEDWIRIHIVLQDEDEEIKYSPKHFLALKTAMEVFSK
ncbi:MAG: hypothetical protein ACI35P_15330 [Bacillus sp. (in: firmicutes)]